MCRKVYPDAIALNVTETEINNQLALVFHVNAYSTDLFMDYPSLKKLSSELEDSLSVRVYLLLRGPRDIAERFVRYFLPDLPVFWKPLSKRNPRGELELWVKGDLKDRIFSPLPEEKLRALVEVVRKMKDDLGLEGSHLKISKKFILPSYSHGQILDIALSQDYSHLLILLSRGNERELLKIEVRTKAITSRIFFPIPFSNLLSVGRELILWHNLTGGMWVLSADNLSKVKEFETLPGTSIEVIADLDYLPRYLIALPGSFYFLEGGNYSLIAGRDSVGFMDGKGKTASLSWPLSIKRDGILLFFTDSLNHSIRVLNLVTGEVKTLAGRGEVGIRDGWGERARFSFPYNLEMWGEDILVLEEELIGVRKLNKPKRRVSTLALSPELERLVNPPLRKLLKTSGVYTFLLADQRRIFSVELGDDQLSLKEEIFTI